MFLICDLVIIPFVYLTVKHFMSQTNIKYFNVAILTQAQFYRQLLCVRKSHFFKPLNVQKKKATNGSFTLSFLDLDILIQEVRSVHLCGLTHRQTKFLRLHIQDVELRQDPSESLSGFHCRHLAHMLDLV